MIDFGAHFAQLLSMLWWLFALLTLASLFKSPWFKGFIGEVMLTCKQLNNSSLTRHILMIGLKWSIQGTLERVGGEYGICREALLYQFGEGWDISQEWGREIFTKRRGFDC